MKGRLPVHEEKPSVQITIANAKRGKEILEKMAATGKSEFWSVPKKTAAKDTILFYVERPDSAIIAVGEALTSASATDAKWYEAKIGKVRLLDSQIPLSELRQMFPNWAWLRNVNMFAYLKPEYARALLKRIDAKTSTLPRLDASGAGFGDAKTNALVEVAAVRKVTQLLKGRGFTVSSREKDAIGYDLDAKRGRTELHVEVKGVSGEAIQFPITLNEVKTARLDPSFRLFVVTDARKKFAKVHEFQGRDVETRFILQPISYMAKEK